MKFRSDGLCVLFTQDGKQGVASDLPKCVSTTEIDEYIIYEKKKEKQYQSYFIEDDYYFSQENGQLMVHRNYYDELIDQVKEVAEIINKSRKPIFYIGQGCAAAHTNLKKVIYKNRIPCTTTIHGKGIFPEKNIMSLQWCVCMVYPQQIMLFRNLIVLYRRFSF